MGWWVGGWGGVGVGVGWGDKYAPDVADGTCCTYRPMQMPGASKRQQRVMAEKLSLLWSLTNE